MTKISKSGYKRNSKDKKEKSLIIPSSNITMKNVDFPVFGVDNLGNTQMMYPGMDYNFPGEYVYEVPMARYGGDPSIPDLSEGWLSKYQDGSEVTPGMRSSAYKRSDYVPYKDVSGSPYEIQDPYIGNYSTVDTPKNLSELPSYRLYAMAKGSPKPFSPDWNTGLNLNDQGYVKFDEKTGYNYQPNRQNLQDFQSIPMEGDKQFNLRRFVLNPYEGQAQTHDAYVKKDGTVDKENFIPKSYSREETMDNVFKDLYAQNLYKFNGDRDAAYNATSDFMKERVEPQYKGKYYEYMNNPNVSEEDKLNINLKGSHMTVNPEETESHVRQQITNKLIDEHPEYMEKDEAGNYKMSDEDISNLVKADPRYKEKLTEYNDVLQDWYVTNKNMSQEEAKGLVEKDLYKNVSKKNGGDISISNLYDKRLLNKYQTAGQVGGPNIIQSGNGFEYGYSGDNVMMRPIGQKEWTTIPADKVAAVKNLMPGLDFDVNKLTPDFQAWKKQAYAELEQKNQEEIKAKRAETIQRNKFKTNPGSEKVLPPPVPITNRYEGMVSPEEQLPPPVSITNRYPGMVTPEEVLPSPVPITNRYPGMVTPPSSGPLKEKPYLGPDPITAPSGFTFEDPAKKKLVKGNTKDRVITYNQEYKDFVYSKGDGTYDPSNQIPFFGPESDEDSIFKTISDYAQYWYEKEFGVSDAAESQLENFEEQPVNVNNESNLVNTPTSSPYKWKSGKAQILAKDSDVDYGNPNTKFWGFKRTAFNDEGMVYIPTPRKANWDGKGVNKAAGMAHFLIKSDLTDGYKDPETTNSIKKSIANNQYLPIYKKDQDGKVRLKYVKGSESLEEGWDYVAALRQEPLSNIDWSSSARPYHDGPSAKKDNYKRTGKGMFGKGISNVLTKDGKDTWMVYKDANGKGGKLGRFNGNSLVFIIEKNGERIIRDFTGTVEAIEKESINLLDEFGVTENDITLAFYDQGSYSAKPKADKNGFIPYKTYSTFNPDETSGAGLAIPFEDLESMDNFKMGGWLHKYQPGGAADQTDLRQIDIANPDSSTLTYVSPNIEIAKKQAPAVQKELQRRKVEATKQGNIDQWGRPYNDPWYGFDPSTKQFTVRDAWGRTPQSDWYGFDPNAKAWSKGTKSQDQKIQEEYNKYDDALNYTRAYLESPRYKEMLHESVDNNSQAFNFFDDSRKRNLETTPPLLILPQPESEPYWGGSSNNATGQVKLYPHGFGTEGTHVHELSHSTDRPPSFVPGTDRRLIPSKDEEYIINNKAKSFKESRRYLEDKEFYDTYYTPEELLNRDNDFNSFYRDYVGEPTEVRARLNEIRKGAKDNNLYDPFNEKINFDIYYNLLKYFDFEKGDKSGFNPMPELQEIFTDDEIIYMLNSISENKPSKTDNLSYGKYGGWLQKYQTTGEVNSELSKYMKQPMDPNDLRYVGSQQAVQDNTRVVVPQVQRTEKQMPAIKQEAQRVNAEMKKRGVKTPEEVYAQEKAEAQQAAAIEAATNDKLYADNQSAFDKAMYKAYNVVSNPLDALGHYNKYGYIQQGNLGNYGLRDQASPMGTAVNMANPFAWLNAGIRLGNDLEEPETYTTWSGAGNALMDALEMLPMFTETRPLVLSGAAMLADDVARAGKYFTPKQLPGSPNLDDIMSLSAPKGNMYGENQVLVQQSRLLNPKIKAKFFKNQAPEVEVMPGTFQKTPKDYGNRITPENYEDFVNRIHGSTDYDFAQAPKTGANLGIGRYGKPGMVYKDAPLNKLGKDIVNAHEKNHGIFAGTISREMEAALLKPFGTNKPIPHYPGKHQGDEVLARMGQFKNAFGMGDDQIFTLGHLNLIRKNYANSFLDNGITAMLSKIKPGSLGEKEFLINMNTYAFGLTPAAIGTGAAAVIAGSKTPQYKYGGWLQKYQTAGPVKPTSNFTLPSLDPQAQQAADYNKGWEAYNAGVRTWTELLQEKEEKKGRPLTTEEKQAWLQKAVKRNDGRKTVVDPNDPKWNFLFKESYQTWDPEFGPMTVMSKPVDVTYQMTDLDKEKARIATETRKAEMTPFAKSLGMKETDPNVQKRASQNANDQVALRILNDKPQGDRNRVEWLNTLTPEERSTIERSQYAGKLEPDYTSQFSQGLEKNLRNLDNLASQSLMPYSLYRASQITDPKRKEAYLNSLKWNNDPLWVNSDYTPEEAANASAMGVLAPLNYPGNLMTGAITGDFGSALRGQRSMPLFTDYRQPEFASAMSGLSEAIYDPAEFLGGVGLLKGAANTAGKASRYIGSRLPTKIDLTRFTGSGPSDLLRAIDAANLTGETAADRLDELRTIYHNAERILTLDEAEILNRKGYGRQSDYPGRIDLYNMGSEELQNMFRTMASNQQASLPYFSRNYDSNLLREDYVRLLNRQQPLNYSDITNAAENARIQTILNSANRAQPSITNTVSSTVPRANTIPINRSGLTKEQVLEKASTKGKDAISKLSETEFQNSVLKPNGEISLYYNDSLEPYFSGAQNVMAMSPKEYADAFNERLDLLNDIIAQRNKSGVEYRVKGLTPDGRLTFYTPPGQYTASTAKRSVVDVLNSDVRDLFRNRLHVPEGESTWNINIKPGQWRGNVEDITNTQYFKGIPGLEMSNTLNSVFADNRARKGSGAYESINEYLKALDLGRVKPGFNSQTQSSRAAWENFINSDRAVGFYSNPKTVYGIMKKDGGSSKYQTGGFRPYDGGYRKPITVNDTRKVNATSGQPINPNVDLKSGDYNSRTIDDVVKASKYYNVDPYTALAIGLQETNLGKSDPNIGHVLDGNYADQYILSNPESTVRGFQFNTRQNDVVNPDVQLMVSTFKNKLDRAKKNNVVDPLLQIQYYNGLGSVYPQTEKDYHKFEMQSIYGVPLTSKGISMMDNPLYGKRILDLKDNVLMADPKFKAYVQSIYDNYIPQTIDRDAITPNYQKGGDFVSFYDAYEQPDLMKRPDGGGVFNNSINKKHNLKTSAEGYYAYINGVTLSKGGSPKSWLDKYK